MNKTTPRKVISVAEAAESLGVSLSQTYKLFHEREIEGFRIKKTIRLYADSVEALKFKNANQLKERFTPKEPDFPPRPRKRQAASFAPFRHLR